MEKIKLIAHRGLIAGPNKNLENNPEQIKKSTELGYDCEIDLWLVYNQFFLGHDEPTYKIDRDFLNTKGLWIHAKNLDALHYLTTTDLWYFWHQNDDCVITSNGYIWTYPDKPLTDRSIRLMPEWKDPNLSTIYNYRCYGICSDYVEKIRTLLSPSAKV